MKALLLLLGEEMVIMAWSCKGEREDWDSTTTAVGGEGDVMVVSRRGESVSGPPWSVSAAAVLDDTLPIWVLDVVSLFVSCSSR